MKVTYYNKGIYSVSDAARLTGVASGRIRRWLRGYRYQKRDRSYASPPLWQGQWEPLGRTMSLGFLDLVEIRFVDAFLKAGVSWATLRQAREKAADLFDTAHPFCTRRFVTDGREVFVELHEETGEHSLLEIAKHQKVFASIIRPFLKELEFVEGEGVVRWWPLGERRQVVLDPSRSFGRPIVSKHGIPTEVLAKATESTGSIIEVARWYDLPRAEIEDAILFEQRLAA